MPGRYSRGGYGIQLREERERRESRKKKKQLAEFERARKVKGWDS